MMEVPPLPESGPRYNLLCARDGTLRCAHCGHAGKPRVQHADDCPLEGRDMETTGEPCDCGHADHDHAPADGCRPCLKCDCDCWFPAEEPVDNSTP